MCCCIFATTLSHLLWLRIWHSTCSMNNSMGTFSSGEDYQNVPVAARESAVNVISPLFWRDSSLLRDFLEKRCQFVDTSFTNCCLKKLLMRRRPKVRVATFQCFVPDCDCKGEKCCNVFISRNLKTSTCFKKIVIGNHMLMSAIVDLRIS